MSYRSLLNPFRRPFRHLSKFRGLGFRVFKQTQTPMFVVCSGCPVPNAWISTSHPLFVGGLGAKSLGLGVKVRNLHKLESDQSAHNSQPQSRDREYSPTTLGVSHFFDDYHFAYPTRKLLYVWCFSRSQTPHPTPQTPNPTLPKSLRWTLNPSAGAATVGA